MSMTYDKMRRDIAEALELSADEIGPEDNLFDAGLDSMRLMGLVMAWQDEGIELDYGALWEYRTLSEWWREIERMQAQV